MIELIIKEFLDGQLDVPSFFEHQTELPDRYVLIEKVGGGQKNQLKSATVAVQSYGPSLYEAAKLNERVKEAMLNLVAVDAVSGVSLNSDYNFTDTETKSYRYQAVFDINHY